MSDLRECPFCGGGETRITEHRHSPTMRGDGGLISVEITHWCPAIPGQPSRNTITRTGRDHASAIAAWNRRAPSADHVPDAGKMVAPPVVKDCLTTQAAFAAGAAEMRERAAEQVDCGCSWRADALAATNKGERFVACGNDPCGAIEARAIRALPLPAAPEGEG